MDGLLNPPPLDVIISIDSFTGWLLFPRHNRHCHNIEGNDTLTPTLEIVK